MQDWYPFFLMIGFFLVIYFSAFLVVAILHTQLHTRCATDYSCLEESKQVKRLKTY
jgi:hypothetical protein